MNRYVIASVVFCFLYAGAMYAAVTRLDSGTPGNTRMGFLTADEASLWREFHRGRCDILGDKFVDIEDGGVECRFSTNLVFRAGYGNQ